MLSDEGAKSRLSGNVDGGILAIEQASSGNDPDLVLGDVGGGLDESGHTAKLWPDEDNNFSIVVVPELSMMYFVPLPN
jgi:hypothetical protein